MRRCDVTTLSGYNDQDTHDQDTMVLCRQRRRLADRGTFVVLVYRMQSGYIFWSVMDEYINMYGDEKLSLDVTSDCCSCSCKCSRRRRRRMEEEEGGELTVIVFYMDIRCH